MGSLQQPRHILISTGTSVPDHVNYQTPNSRSRSTMPKPRSQSTVPSQDTVNRSHPGHGQAFPPRSRSNVPTQVTVNRSHPGHGQAFPPRSRSTVHTQVTVNPSNPGHGLPVYSEVKVNQRSSRLRSTCPSKIKVIRSIIRLWVPQAHYRF
jgi:hypothetical protein